MVKNFYLQLNLMDYYNDRFPYRGSDIQFKKKLKLTGTEQHNYYNL